MRRAFITTALTALAITLYGCALPMADATLRRVEGGPSFSALLTDPDAFKGRGLLVGGMIAEVENLKGESRVYVVERPLDSARRPRRDAPSGGRFVAIADRFLDPAVYREGLMVTVAGTVDGTNTRPLGGTEYRYPVVRVIEIHIAETNPYRPRIHLGIGVGGSF